MAIYNHPNQLIQLRIPNPAADIPGANAPAFINSTVTLSDYLSSPGKFAPYVSVAPRILYTDDPYSLGVSPRPARRVSLRDLVKIKEQDPTAFDFIDPTLLPSIAPTYTIADPYLAIDLKKGNAQSNESSTAPLYMRLFDIYAGSPGPTSDQQVTLIDTVGNQSQVPYSWLVKTFNDNMSSIGFQLGGQTLSIQQIASKIVRNDMPPTPPNIVSPPSQPAPVLTVAAVAAAPLPVAAPPATPAPAASPAVPVAPQAAPAAVSPSPLPPITTLILPSVRDWMRRLRTIRTADTATHMGKKMPLVDFFAAAATDSTLQPAKPDQKITFRDTDGNKTTKRVADVLTGLRAGHLQVQPAGPGRISRALGLVKRKAINTAFWPFGNFKRLIVTAAIAATGVVVYQYATRDTMPDDVARLVAAEAAQNAPISAADSRRGAVEGYVSASGLDANNPAVYPNEATATAISMYRPAVVAAYGALKKELNISAESQQVAGADEVRLINTQLRLMIETNLASQPANLDRVGAMTKAASASYRIRKELLGSDASQTGTAEYASAKDVTPTDFAAALLLANIDPTIATQVTQISDLAPAYKRAAQLLTDSSVAVPANIAQGMPVAPASGSLGAGATPPPATQPTKPNTAEDLAKEIFGP